MTKTVVDVSSVGCLVRNNSAKRFGFYGEEKFVGRLKIKVLKVKLRFC